MSSGRSGRSGRSDRSSRQQPEWRQRPDGYWEIPGDGIPFYQGTDGNMHQVPRIRDMTSSLDQDESSLLLQYLMTTNFINNLGESVEFTIANVVTELHDSSSLADPYGDAGPHIGVQLTNDALWSDNGRTHMLHFRPTALEYSFFYKKSQNRKKVSKEQDIRNQNRQNKKDEKGGKRGGPGGGAGAAGSSSRRGNSGGSQQYSGYGGSSSNSGQYYQQGGYGYSHGGRTYSVEGLPQLFSFLLLQVWRGMMIGHPSVPVHSERITNGFSGACAKASLTTGV
ncbi:hypothetical protein F4860DRAFT_513557 [Xylaria cubensis]|nr:hypothetical protein F4860DRAFT_513557 [Xylaria cubensis]